MKTLKQIVDQGLEDTIRVDPAMDERYGDNPLFRHKIERLYDLLKDTPLAPNSKKQAPKAAPSKSPQRASPTN